jgi:hypothetical protein
VDDHGAELVETVARWTHALGDGSCSLFGDFRDLAGFGRFQ